MKIIDVIELKNIQLDILKHVDSFCKTNNITYFLCGGSAIGAVRHKGFIPWDDDIDIAMLRDDYDRFIKTYSENDTSVYKLHYFKLDHKVPYPYVKIDNSETVFLEELENDYKMGVNIDLFPVDSVPESLEKQKEIFSKYDRLVKIFTVKRLPLKRRRGILKNIVLALSHVMFSFRSFRSLIRSFEDNALKYKDEDSKYCAGIVWGYGRREINLKENWSEALYVPFEDMMVPVPKGYDGYLSSVYGDYMKLPPEEKRISHHHFIAYWK